MISDNPGEVEVGGGLKILDSAGTMPQNISPMPFPKNTKTKYKNTNGVTDVTVFVFCFCTFWEEHWCWELGIS